jgi:hypothetical protein
MIKIDVMSKATNVGLSWMIEAPLLLVEGVGAVLVVVNVVVDVTGLVAVVVVGELGVESVLPVPVVVLIVEVVGPVPVVVVGELGVESVLPVPVVVLIVEVVGPVPVVVLIVEVVGPVPVVVLIVEVVGPVPVVVLIVEVVGPVPVVVLSVEVVLLDAVGVAVDWLVVMVDVLVDGFVVFRVGHGVGGVSNVVLAVEAVGTVTVLVVELDEVCMVVVLVEKLEELDTDVVLTSTQLALTTLVWVLLHENSNFALQAIMQALSAHDGASAVPSGIGVQPSPSQQ